MTVTDELHRLVDQLDDDAARAALPYLQYLALPRVLREAPIDDEPETDEERAAVAQARAEIAAGHVVRHEDVRREFGLE